MTSSNASPGLAATFAGNLREARKAAGLTQSQLATRLGLSDGMAVSRWERGEHRPELDNLVAAANALGRDVAWFYSDHDQVAA